MEGIHGKTRLKIVALFWGFRHKSKIFIYFGETFKTNPNTTIISLNKNVTIHYRLAQEVKIVQMVN